MFGVTTVARSSGKLEVLYSRLSLYTKHLFNIIKRRITVYHIIRNIIGIY